MVTRYRQAHRLLEVNSPLGQDALLLTAFTGEEGLSRPFRFQLDLLSPNGAIAARDLAGKRIAFTVGRPDGPPRHFNGFVSRFWEAPPPGSGEWRE